MPDLIEQIKQLADMIKTSSYAVVLTGAGIAVEEEDYEDFYSANRLWTMVSPDDFTINRFKKDPDNFYESGAPYFSILFQSKPNEVHTALTELERRGLIKTIITKNIDGLHKLAGSRNVLEIRGTVRTASCVECENHYSVEDFLDDDGECEYPLRCPGCGEILKPDVALPGEPLPEDYHDAVKEAKRADLFLIIGSTMQTNPENELPAECENIVVINREQTYYDKEAKLVINESPDKVMTLLMQQLSQ